MVRVSLNMRELADVFSFFSLRISTYVARYVYDNVRWSIDLSLWLIASFSVLSFKFNLFITRASSYNTNFFSFLYLPIMMLIWNATERERERVAYFFVFVQKARKHREWKKPIYASVIIAIKKEKKVHYSHFIYFLCIRC